jgi:hypothetical protein
VNLISHKVWGVIERRVGSPRAGSNSDKIGIGLSIS